MCEPPSILRKTSKPFIAPCTETQIDRNGNCFEPQVTVFDTVNGRLVPRVSGCGCIRTPAGKRIHCPAGQDVYNNSCLAPCPQGYSGIKDKNGILVSMYCQKECPESQLVRGKLWTFLGNQCVKETYSRLKSQELPITTLSMLAKSPLGASLNARNPGSARPFGSNSSGLGSLGNPFVSWLPSSWEQDLLFITLILFAFAFIFYAGPTFLPLFGKAVGTVAEGVSTAAGTLVTGAAKAVSTVAQGSAELAADIEKGTGAATRAGLDLAAANKELKAANIMQKIKDSKLG